jgi:capsular polysaccharide biosynthesis protein
VADVRRVAAGALPFPGACSPAAGAGSGSDLRLCRLRDAYVAVEFGAVVAGSGAVMRASAAEALAYTPDLTRLPNAMQDADGPVLEVTPDLPRLDKASVFLPWGARFNYAHFLLDGLSGLALLTDQGLLREYPAVCPPLHPWQRTAIELLLGEEAVLLRETQAPLLAVGEVVFASTMDHFVHTPDRPLDRVRERMLGRLGPAMTCGRRIYLSHRLNDRCRIANEAELVQALEARGFETVEPATLAVPAQIELFRSAAVIVGATGAAMANCLFSGPETRVVELQVGADARGWVERLCGFTGAAWRACPAVAQPNTGLAGLQDVESWEAPIDQVLAAVEG